MKESESKKQLTESFHNILEDRESRIIACEDNLALFSLYYFTKFHHHKMPEFHKEMYRDVSFEKLDGVVWEMFRSSAKTSITKIALIHGICYQRYHFPIWVSFDEKKAASNLFDVAIELQTNQKLIEDFGQLFYDEKITTQEERKSKKKSIKEFITSNNIRVKAYSTGMSIRGEVFGEYRPDLLIMDDIETIKTAVSEARTEQVKGFLDEMFFGAAGYAKYIILANKITNDGSITFIEDKVKNDPRWVIRNVPVVDNDGNITWPEKYVFTDEEADQINATIPDKKNHKQSLETIKRKGLTQYNREMMNQPLSDNEREIKLDWLQPTFSDEEIKNITRNRYITIDVADSKARHKSNPDYTATTVVDVDGQANWYVQYVHQDRYNSPELIDWIFYLWETYKPIKIGVEKKALEDQVMPYIRARSEETKIFPVITELKHGGVRKEDRIRGSLQGRLQQKKIKFRTNAIDHTDILKAQLFDFPRSAKDDLSDTLAYVDQISAKPFYGQAGSEMSQLHKEFYEHKRMMKKNTSVSFRIRGL